MGNFHCITSGCAEVRYQRYIKGGGVRYRYPGEEWITVDGDDFELRDQRQGQCTGNIRYIINFSALEIAWETGNIERKFNRVWLSPFAKIADPNNPLHFDDFYYGNRSNIYGQPFHVRAYQVHPSGITTQSQWTLPQGHNSYFLKDSIEDIEIRMFYWKNTYDNHLLPPESDNCGNCDLTIYKDETIIYQESRPECPEVEILEGECELSDRTEVITIDKIPFLERLEVVPYLYSEYRSPAVPAPIVQAEPIPEECLNIYVNNTATFLAYNRDNPESFLHPNATPFQSFITQICSDPDCPPPKYEVICDCEGSECPTGTCPVECGGTVCCYDTNTGIAVESIPLENYTGGGIS